MNSSDQPVSHAPPPLRVRRWGPRLTAISMVCVGLIYLSLPLWLPTAWIARRVSADLSHELHRTVTIGRLQVGWRTGVVVEDLVIADRNESVAPNLLRIDRIRCGLTPLYTLWTGKVRQVEIHRPQIWLAIDQDGRINVADLADGDPPTLPSYNYVVRNAACHIMTPKVAQTFSVDQLKCRLEPETGLLRVFGIAQVDRTQAEHDHDGRFVLDAEVSIPRLRRDVALSGEIRLEWDRLTLKDLPVPLATHLPVEQVDGLSSGQLNLVANPDLGIDFDLYLLSRGVRLLRKEIDKIAQVPDAEMQCAGHWNPNIDEILLEKFDYRTPAVRLMRVASATEPVMRLDPGGEVPFALKLRGQVRDWVALRREFPEVDLLIERIGSSLSGAADFQLEVMQAPDREKLLLKVDADSTQWRIEEGSTCYLDAGPDVPKSFLLQVSHDHERQSIEYPAMTVRVGGVELRIDGGLPVPGSEIDQENLLQWLRDSLPLFDTQCTLSVDRLETLPELFPVLNNVVDTHTWRGSGRIQAGIRAQPQGAGIDISADLSERSAFNWRSIINKTIGQPLRLRAGFVLPYDPSQPITGLGLELVSGPGRIWLDPQRARLDYAFAFVDASAEAAEANDVQPLDAQRIAVDASCRLPIEVRNIDRLIELFPVVMGYMESAPVHQLKGDVQLTLAGDFSYRPDDLIWNNRLDLRADRLAVAWDDWLDKPPGRPVTLTAEHQFRILDGRREQSIHVGLDRAAGRLSGAWAFASNSRADDLDDYEQVGFVMDIEDLAEWLAWSPKLARLVDAYDLHGQLSVHADGVLAGGTRMLTVDVDAGRAGWTLPMAMPLHKSSGVPAELHLAWQVDQAEMQKGLRRWALTDGRLRLGGFQMHELTGSALARSEPGWSLWRRPRWFYDTGSMFESLDLRSAGEVRFDSDLADLHPAMEEIMRRYALAGELDWTTKMVVQGDRVRLTGGIDADDAQGEVLLDAPPVKAIRKSADLPTALEFDLGFDRHAPARAPGLKVHQLALDMGGNRFALQGDLAWDWDTDLGLRPRQGRLQLEADIRDADRLDELLADAKLHLVGGKVRAYGEMQISPEKMTADNIDLLFDRLSVTAGHDPLYLDGQLHHDGQGTHVRDLQWSWGKSGGTLSGIIYPPDVAETNLIGIAGEGFDVADLTNNIDALPALSSVEAPASGENILRKIFDVLARRSWRFDVHYDWLSAVLPLDVTVRAEALNQNLTVEDGVLNLDFSCLVDGGHVRGSVKTDLRVEDPTYHLQYEAARIQPGPVIEAYLATTFPGMTATGPLTLIDETYQKVFIAPDDPNFEAGRGELVIEGGVVRGRAAPRWMTQIFPRLNLAEFDFTYMHSWFEKYPSGRVRHQIIYQGQYYNIYSVGYNDPDRYMEYEVGIDLMGDLDSRYWAESGQGRIPLFIKSGYINEDGQLTDEAIFFKPQRLVWSLLLQNNPVITAYHAVRKRVLDEK